MSPLKRSAVWDYFTKVADDIQCTECKTKVKANAGNTSNLKRHLQSRHPIEYKKMKAAESTLNKPTSSDEPVPNSKKRQLTLEEQVKKKDKLSNASTRAKQLTTRIATMICLDYQPFSIVEDAGFRALMEELEPRYEIPTRQKLSKEIIPHMYEQKRELIQRKIQSEDLCGVSFTTDSWTSRSTEAYVSLTMHYVDSAMDLQTVCLAVRPFELHHTSENIHDLIKEVLKEYEIFIERIPVYFLTDNARNMTSAMAMLNVQSRSCFAHTLQLVINDAIKSFRGIQNILSKIRTISGYFHRSTKACQALRSAQAQLHLPENKLIQDVTTRFNSSYYMIKRAVQQRKAIALALTEESTSTNNLSAYDWKVGEQLVEVLSPFEEVTEIMSGEAYPTASLIIPALSQLKELLNQDVEDLNDFRKELLTNIDTRWPNIKSDIVFTLATFIDPRFKLVGFTSDEREEVISKVVELCSKDARRNVPSGDKVQEMSHSVVTETSTQKKGYNFFMSFSQKVEKEYMVTSHENNSLQSIKTEICMYLNETPVPINNAKKPLTWWKDNRSRFPNLFKIARCFLGIPATSISSERIFSKAGQVVTAKRSLLKSALVEKLVFLKSNWNVV